MNKINYNKCTGSTRLIIKELISRGIEVECIYPGKLFKCKYLDNTEYLYNQVISKTSIVAVKICDEKNIAKKILALNNISIANGKTINTNIEKNIDLEYPLIVKPINRAHGSDIYTNIKSFGDLKNTLDKMKDIYKDVLVEEQFEGEDYRVFATNEKAIAVTKRIPANVVGDGKNTIKKLIEIKNQDPRRCSTSFRSKTHVQIDIDEHILDYLKKQNLNITDIPKNNEQVFLRKNANISTGGDAIDCTDMVHESVKDIAVRVIKSIPGLSYGGVDIMTKDVTKKQNKYDYIVLEVNASPGINIHHFPIEGKSRDAAGAIIDILFPETKKNS